MKIYLRPHDHGSIGWSFDLNRFIYLDKNYSSKVQNFSLSELKKHTKDVSLQIRSPLEIIWHITSRCNMNCEYCLAPKKIPSVSSKEENLIIEKLNKSQVLRVNLSGGEPFLHNRLIDVLKKLKKNKHWVSISTNGYLAYTFIQEVSPYVDQMMISLDSVDRDEIMIFKGTKKQDVFEKVELTIKECIKHKIPVRVGTLITKKHHKKPKELENFIKRVKRCGVTELSMSQFVPRGKAKLVQDKYALIDQEYFDIVEASQNKFDSHKFRIIARNKDRYKGYLVLNPNGDVYTLDSGGKDTKIGNILKQDFEDLFSPTILTFYKL